MKRLMLVCMCVLGTCACRRTLPADPAPSVLPVPRSEIYGGGTFRLSAATPVVAVSDDERTAWAVGALDELYASVFGPEAQPRRTDAAADGAVRFVCSDAMEAEEYRLTVDSDRIEIVSGGPEGAFYAVQTLRQLLPRAAFSGADAVEIPCVAIEDGPCLAYRGLMLDVARHFFTVEEVKRTLDLMAMHKLNVFHWHLTDDQGWRVELECHPELAARGAWHDPATHDNDRTCLDRAVAGGDSTMLLPRKNFREIGGRSLYGGYYTRDDIREVVAYAASLGIDVIPEVDMPGHSLQVVAAHPDLSCTGCAEWGETFSTPLCLGNDATLAFCREICAELFELFPFGYFHLGADEVEKHNWQHCPKCQRRIASLGLGDEHGLQAWFVHEMEAFFAEHGRRLIGWDEIVNDGMSRTCVVQWWRNWVPASLQTAAANGNDLIVNTGEFFYLDGAQNRNSLSKVYGFDPAQVLAPEHLGQVLGVHANLWTEFVPSFDRACFQIFPRLFAASEIMWSAPERRDPERFPARATVHLQRLDAEGWNYRIPDLEGFCDRNVFTERTSVTIRKPFDAVEVYYTLDGSLPDRSALRYEGPIPISEDCTLRLRPYTSSGKGGEVVTAEYRRMEPMEARTVGAPLSEGLVARWYDYRGEACAEIGEAPLRNTYEGVSVAIPEGVAGNIGLIFDGYFLADEEGVYSFYTYSDDGSTIAIDGMPVVENDGPHSREERTGQIALRRGLHAIEVRYFDSNGGLLEAGTVDADGVRRPFDRSMFRHE